MTEVVPIILWTLLAGIAMPVGAAVACIEQIRPDWLKEEFRHFLTAFGGGVLLAAVALVLVPEGSKDLDVVPVTLCFLVGGVAFMALDIFLNAIRRPASQAAAMLADFIPEAIALGALFTSSPSLAPLLAILIAMQNLPEGFNASREISASSGARPWSTVVSFLFLSLLGPLCGLLGFFFLASHHSVLSFIMLFSSGGILYLIFQDIAPQAKLKRHWGPPLGAVLGFLLGLVAHMLAG